MNSRLYKHRSYFLFVFWEAVVFLASLFTVIIFLFDFILPPDWSYRSQLIQFDGLLCVLFLLDFLYFFSVSADKIQFFKKNWIDLVSSFPFYDTLRAFRIIRVIRIFRALRLIRVFRYLRLHTTVVNFLFKTKVRSILSLYIISLVIVLFYCALGFYEAEKGINENVSNYFDAVWWAFITVTSVGYGDIYPKTSEGRIIAIILSLSGIGLFSLITAEIAAIFVNLNNKQKP